MKDKVTSINGGTYEVPVGADVKVQEDVVMLVERVLTLAKSGYVQEICIAMYASDGNSMDGTAGEMTDPIKMYGQLCNLTASYRDQYMEVSHMEDITE